MNPAEKLSCPAWGYSIGSVERNGAIYAQWEKIPFDSLRAQGVTGEKSLVVTRSSPSLTWGEPSAFSSSGSYQRVLGATWKLLDVTADLEDNGPDGLVAGDGSGPVEVSPPYPVLYLESENGSSGSVFTGTRVTQDPDIEWLQNCSGTVAPESGVRFVAGEVQEGNSTGNIENWQGLQSGETGIHFFSTTENSWVPTMRLERMRNSLPITSGNVVGVGGAVTSTGAAYVAPSIVDATGVTDGYVADYDFDTNMLRWVSPENPYFFASAFSNVAFQLWTWRPERGFSVYPWENTPNVSLTIANSAISHQIVATQTTGTYAVTTFFALRTNVSDATLAVPTDNRICIPLIVGDFATLSAAPPPTISGPFGGYVNFTQQIVTDNGRQIRPVVLSSLSGVSYRAAIAFETRYTNGFLGYITGGDLVYSGASWTGNSIHGKVSYFITGGLPAWAS